MAARARERGPGRCGLAGCHRGGHFFNFRQRTRDSHDDLEGHSRRKQLHVQPDGPVHTNHHIHRETNNNAGGYEPLYVCCIDAQTLSARRSGAAVDDDDTPAVGLDNTPPRGEEGRGSRPSRWCHLGQYPRRYRPGTIRSHCDFPLARQGQTAESPVHQRRITAPSRPKHSGPQRRCLPRYEYIRRASESERGGYPQVRWGCEGPEAWRSAERALQPREATLNRTTQRRAGQSQ
ncbi:hypothetical protein F5X68DRAFT_56258 [Plectosphaerella plurivora]|uniref:Uncharacterized protein n=1 Tax=Plectosphaerella plurivora TaxID=936078 RepID=A0A9P8V1K5_9PEZI|nr:hypothetical protein F5X68DRAFT_56258 [Plectosphaerella plurivora]